MRCKYLVFFPFIPLKYFILIFYFLLSFNYCNFPPFLHYTISVILFYSILSVLLSQCCSSELTLLTCEEVQRQPSGHEAFGKLQPGVLVDLVLLL